MRNISAKIETLRSARAESRVGMAEKTLRLVRDGTGPKGDPLPLARAAAVLAAKKTSDLIPYCHPILIDSVVVEFEFHDAHIAVTAEVSAVAKTGVEMEAMTAATVAALTIYDMLKPVDSGMEILGTKLLEKRGGKSSFRDRPPRGFKAAVLVASDGTAQGLREDKSGQMIRERLQEWGLNDAAYVIVPDEKAEVRRKLLNFCEAGIPLVLTTGGTGLGPRDVTVEATREVIEREVPGMAEAMRSYGQRRTPYAMLSRGLVGIRGKTLIVNLPGSSAGVKESMDAIFPALFHVYPIADGGGQ
jgi:molybdenum cofactor biosynthesis protein MoaC